MSCSSIGGVRFFSGTTPIDCHSNQTKRTVENNGEASNTPLDVHFYCMKTQLYIAVYDGGGCRGAAEFVHDEEVGFPA